VRRTRGLRWSRFDVNGDRLNDECEYNRHRGAADDD
jgi:hypothetical protein